MPYKNKHIYNKMLEKILSTVPENVLGPEMPFWLPAKHILQLDRVALCKISDTSCSTMLEISIFFCLQFENVSN